MRLHGQFEWDPRKARANLKKHRVNFTDAEAVLADDHGDVYHVEEEDDEHSEDEARYITIGSDPQDRGIILKISWTDRSTDDEKVTRIISARPVTPRERGDYAEEIRGR
jgi:uncharacterized DUF497 family protein